MSNLSVPQLSPSSLFESQARSDAMRLDVYNRILGTVHQKIRMTSTLPTSPQMTSFNVPEWHPGCPSFDVKDCILYIVWQLRNSGFRVLYVSPNRLLISWKEQSIQYYQEESPIRQAMLASASASASSATPASALRQPEKKKAANYRPASEGVVGLLAQPPERAQAKRPTVTFI
jgi:hypothetical protein